MEGPWFGYELGRSGNEGRLFPQKDLEPYLSNGSKAGLFSKTHFDLCSKGCFRFRNPDGTLNMTNGFIAVHMHCLHAGRLRLKAEPC